MGKFASTVRKVVNPPKSMNVILGVGVVAVGAIVVATVTGFLPFAIRKGLEARALVENPVRNALARFTVAVPNNAADPGED